MVDASALGADARKSVEVRVLSPAPDRKCQILGVCAAAGGENPKPLQFPIWCRIVRIVRTHFGREAAVNNPENPAVNSELSKLPKNLL